MAINWREIQAIGRLGSSRLLELVLMMSGLMAIWTVFISSCRVL
ncbi:hypothetical protein BURCENBC7_AP3501 [Burkholderia cenocepacia BC7]|nr:hypothetical protein BURCENBC7_AP3501 [Burkholderia cenocepacia BC7]